MSADERPRSLPSLALWALVAAACLARFVFLDADPKFEFWVGYVADEGRWVETARNLALFGEPRLYTLSKLHVVLSPTDQLASLVAFKLFGVGFWTARLWPAVCSVILLVFLARSLGRFAPGLPQFLALAVVGFEPLTLMLGRTALPEIPSLVFMVGAFFAIIAARRRLAGAALGGLLLAVAASMKLTSVLVAPAFPLMILLSGVAQSRRERWLRLGAFGLGAGIPALAALAVAIGAGFVRLGAHSDIMKPILHALDFGSPYTILSRYFMPPIEQGSVVLLLLGAWVCSWVLPFRAQFGGTPLGELYRHSGIWAAGWFVMVGLLDYTPSRYTVHCIVPLAIHVAAGLALWREIGPARIVGKALAASSRWRLVALAWLAFPAATLAAMVTFALVVPAGGPFDRLSLRIVLVAAMQGSIALTLLRCGTDDRAVRGVFAFTIGGALLVAALDAVSALVAPEFPRAAAFAKLISLVALAGAIAWDAVHGGELPGRPRWQVFAVGLALAGFALQSLPLVLRPTYSIRDASRDLGHRFAGARVVRSIAAGSLLLETTIPYRSEGAHGVDFDGLVSPIRDLAVPPHFVPETTYFLEPHPRYRIEGRFAMDSGRIRVEVFRRAAPGQAPGLTQPQPDPSHHSPTADAPGR